MRRVKCNSVCLDLSTEILLTTSRGLHRLAYYQNVIHYSAYRAYRSNAMFKCDIFRSIFGAAPWSKHWKKAAECCRILGFDSPWRQFIFNALS